MLDAPDKRLLEALLDSWERNNTILVNLLRALPEGGLGGEANGQQPIRCGAVHAHPLCKACVRLRGRPRVRERPARAEWRAERDRERIAAMLNDSAEAVREAVKGRVEAGRDMDLHYDHPILFLQHMVWHEGYHHGQIKLVLKLTGRPMTNDEAGPVTWRVWMNKASN